ncbi:RAD52 DNA repair protein RADC [Talaromyces stipitatus ATCC 10500]|uniref:RAD52 homolog n=1 Tax=Talaromyces stipitatus (strain ATCC 10500 / CBS 375.48 / QM 6759 / NRRL 1006) TaxID=441959 RepID=B8LUI1_TALSN|nr:RAD52 DNA repair protein RADC [Talaromyces stipitatus ATCC 10500]EED23754.1 RAD52 DNA repair protein RADC [Talaromyces stipitatus ATCC 10500]
MPAVGDQHREPPSTVTGTANPFDEGPRRISEYTAREVATLQSRLDRQLGPEYISARSGPSGQKVHYLAAEKCINLANEVFGFNGWSSSIQNIQIDFVDESPTTGKISLGLSVIVRVTLRDGTYHEDIGYGHIENCKGKAAAFEKAKKEGTTDGLKRALRTFGNVLGNCIYDKEYLARVTRLKVTPSKWDAENLHRHPDYAPVKKELVQEKKLPEDVELPPRPVDYNSRKETTSHETSTTFDGDGEFGSDVFDEADFVANTTGNPDEVVLDVDTPQPIQKPQTRPQLPPAQQRPPGHQQRPAPPNSAMVTPSKPERQWAGPAPPASAGYQNNPNQNAMAQRGGVNENYAASNPANPLGNRSSKELQRNNTASGIVKTEPSANPSNPTAMNNDQNKNGPAEPSVGFYSARAVDILRDNPRASPMAPKFDPHAESPSIRKTAGIDHTKSVPVSKPMLFGTGQSPAGPGANTGTGPGAGRNFINPSTDAHRRIGAPGGNTGGIASPVNKGFTTSSFRPLTRPAVDNRNVSNNDSTTNNNNRSTFTTALSTHDPSLKRPPLNDVTNAPLPGSIPVSGDIKRPRLSNEGVHGNTAQPPQQQQPQQ